jgi:hypothetical protein
MTHASPRWIAGLLSIALLFFGGLAPIYAQSSSTTRIAALKYSGGGDWYQAQSPLPTFLEFVRQETLLDIAPQADVVELSSDKLFTYPFLVMSGHGNVRFTDEEARRLRRYLEGGGFLFIDDDYGMDEYVRRELQKVFPDKELQELPFSHPIYHTRFEFPDGPPKIHEHDGKPPRGYGILHDDRVVVYYTVESNISDGWEPPSVHDNPPETRRAALQMGTNILTYALMY